MLLVLFININEQIMPMFLPQRALYEARERPSKIYRWTSMSISLSVEFCLCHIADSSHPKHTCFPISSLNSHGILCWRLSCTSTGITQWDLSETRRPMTRLSAASSSSYFYGFTCYSRARLPTSQFSECFVSCFAGESTSEDITSSPIYTGY